MKRSSCQSLVEEHTASLHPEKQQKLCNGRADKPVSPRTQKRTDYLSWEDYFMSIAFLSAQRSKDPSSQVGACIVNLEKKIVGIGYNGMPNGCSDDVLPWDREKKNKLQTKYPYVCHAEMNAICNKNSADVKGCTMYVALFPCNECAKLIIQSGISKVIYYSDKYRAKEEMVASRKLLEMAEVQFEQYQPEKKEITIDFTAIENSTYDVQPSADVSIVENCDSDIDLSS